MTRAAMGVTESSPRYVGWRVLAAAVVGMALSPGPLFWGSLGIFVAPLQSEFGWNRAAIMFALLGVTIVSIPAMPLVGRLIDKWGVRRVLLPSIMCLALLLASVPLVVVSLFTLYAVFFTAGFLTVGTQSVSYVRVISAWFDRRRGLAIGITASGLGLGYAVVPGVVQWATEMSGWRAGYLVLAALVLFISLPLMALFIRDEPAAQGSGSLTRAPPVDGLSLAAAMRTREFWLIAIGICIVATVFNAMLPSMVPLLTDRGTPTRDAVLAVSVMGIAMTISRVLVGYLIDVIFAPLVAFVVFALAAGGIAILALGASAQMAIVAAFLIGVGFGAETDLMGFLVSRYFGLRAFGQIYGLMLSAFLIGTGLGPYLLNLANDLHGSYNLALWIGGAMGLLAAAGFLLLRRYELQIPEIAPATVSPNS